MIKHQLIITHEPLDVVSALLIANETKEVEREREVERGGGTNTSFSLIALGRESPIPPTCACVTCCSRGPMSVEEGDHFTKDASRQALLALA